MNFNTPAPMILNARMASELMSENPISIDRGTTVRDALAILIDRDVTAAPVIDERGRPIGVISMTDILIHDREISLPGGLSTNLSVSSKVMKMLDDSFQLEVADPTTVEQIMTPDVFTVELSAPSSHVVNEMVRLKVHHLFVIDPQGIIVGVISTSDILRRLVVGHSGIQ
jgi:CBS domain-containing protein